MAGRSRPRLSKKEVLRMVAALAVALAVWTPFVHRFFLKDSSFYRSAQGISQPAREITAYQLAAWNDPENRSSELWKMYNANPEWDFMNRTYFVLSLANMALRDPSYKETACDAMDTIIDNTLKLEKENGFQYFLLPYAQQGYWIHKPPRSVFVDGEIALMLAARRMVEEKPEYKPLLKSRIDVIIEQMKKSSVLSAESYPDECWLFCNSIALAAVRISDVLDGTDHSEFLSEWVKTAKAKLIDPETGLLVSAYGVYGNPVPSGLGAEGSTIWMACHMLQVVDPDFAKEQYDLACKELDSRLFGFTYAREWPRSCETGTDIDSGPVLPLIDASASSTALAVVGAASFGDDERMRRLLAFIDFGGLPVKKDGALHYAMSNLVGDAVILYAMTEGPLWNLVQAKMR